MLEAILHPVRHWYRHHYQPSEADTRRVTLIARNHCARQRWERRKDGR